MRKAGILSSLDGCLADNNPAPLDALVIAPHPDDEVIGCAGVIQRTLAAKKRVTVVILTNGDEVVGTLDGRSGTVRLAREQVRRCMVAAVESSAMQPGAAFFRPECIGKLIDMDQALDALIAAATAYF